MFFDLFTTALIVTGLISWHNDIRYKKAESMSDEYRAMLKSFEYKRYMDAYKRENPDLEDWPPEEDTGKRNDNKGNKNDNRE
jgi:hypothetical protein